MLPPQSHPPSLQPHAPVAVGALCEAFPSVPWHVEYMRTPARRRRYDAKMRRASNAITTHAEQALRNAANSDVVTEVTRVTPLEPSE